MSDSGGTARGATEVAATAPAEGGTGAYVLSFFALVVFNVGMLTPLVCGLAWRGSPPARSQWAYTLLLASYALLLLFAVRHFVAFARALNKK